MTEKWTPEDEERLRRALQQEAAKVYPSPGGLEQILARRRKSRWTMAWQNPAVLGVAAAVVTAVAAIGVGAAMLGGPDENAAGPATGATTTSAPVTSEPASPSPSPTEEVADEPIASQPTTSDPTRPPVTQAPEAGFTGAVPVYFVTDTRAGYRLAREWIPVQSRRNAVEVAVSRMIEDPPVPGYDTLWSPSTEVRSAEVRDGAIKVDLSVSEAPIVRDDASLAIQQLVYTATAAASLIDRDYGSLPVRILVEGERVDELGGVDVSEAVGRAPDISVRQLVQINDPSQGAVVRNPVTVTGEASVFEATVVWELFQAGELVHEGFDTAEKGAPEFGRFAFELPGLEPGEYTIVITEDDPSDGEGGEPMSDERTFTVVD